MADEQIGELVQRPAVISGHLLGPVVETAQLDVQVPHLPEHAGQPAELGAQAPGAHRENIGEHVEARPHPAGRHPHLMEGLDVLAEPRAGLLSEHRSGILAQHPVGELTERRGRADARRSEVRQIPEC